METNKFGRNTTFMLVVYFIHKPNNMRFTLDEIARKENRKQFDSYDFTYGVAKNLIRDEQLGLKKLLRMTSKWLGNYYGGYIIATKADQKILTFGRDGELKYTAKPEFFHDKELNQVTLVRLNPTQLVSVAVKNEPMPLYSNVNANRYNTWKNS